MSQGDVILSAEHHEFRQLEKVSPVPGAGGQDGRLDPDPGGGDSWAGHDEGCDAGQEMILFREMGDDLTLRIAAGSGKNAEFLREAVRPEAGPGIVPKGGNEDDFIDEMVLAQVDLKPFHVMWIGMNCGAITDGADLVARTGAGELLEFSVDVFQPFFQLIEGKVLQLGLLSVRRCGREKADAEQQEDQVGSAHTLFYRLRWG